MSLGTKFYEELIQTRGGYQQTANHIVSFLKTNKISYTLNYICPSTGLIGGFFKEGILLTLNKEQDRPILIGKGVCMDTGGFNMKNGGCHIEQMCFDKNGAILAIAAAIDLRAPCNVFLVENKPNLYPGQILTEQYTGTRVYIKDTDAEGRIGLAHLLGLNKDRKCKKALTLATLTGSASVFTGDGIAALVHAKSKALRKKVIDSPTNDLWPSNSHPKYDEAVKSKIKGADICNVGSALGGGGSQKAYSFLKHFWQEGELLHVDMAAMMTDKDGNALEWGLEQVKWLYKLLEGSND